MLSILFYFIIVIIYLFIFKRWRNSHVSSVTTMLNIFHFRDFFLKEHKEISTTHATIFPDLNTSKRNHDNQGSNNQQPADSFAAFRHLNTGIT